MCLRKAAREKQRGDACCVNYAVNPRQGKRQDGESLSSSACPSCLGVSAVGRLETLQARVCEKRFNGLLID